MEKLQGKELKYFISDELQLNKVTSYGNGHEYVVGDGETIWHEFIDFTHGGRTTDNHQIGLTHEALILICIDRLQYFNDTFNSTENDGAIEHLKQALLLCEQRTLDRHQRGVLGNDGEDYNA